MSKESIIKVFEGVNVRIVWDDEKEEYFFSVNDIVEVLTESKDVKQYIKRMRSRDPELNSSWGTICTPTRMRAADGKFYKTQAATMKGILRIVQSIPSKKALTDEWDRAGIKDEREFAILTNILTKAWSGMTTGQYKKYKGLTKQNLRDNMTNLEMTLNMLAEGTAQYLFFCYSVFKKNYVFKKYSVYTGGAQDCPPLWPPYRGPKRRGISKRGGHR